jgi:hypothetical protein
MAPSRREAPGRDGTEMLGWMLGWWATGSVSDVRPRALSSLSRHRGSQESGSNSHRPEGNWPQHRVRLPGARSTENSSDYTEATATPRSVAGASEWTRPTCGRPQGLPTGGQPRPPAGGHLAPRAVVGIAVHFER